MEELLAKLTELEPFITEEGQAIYQEIMAIANEANNVATEMEVPTETNEAEIEAALKDNPMGITTE